jgi:hypothetical protein
VDYYRHYGRIKLVRSNLLTDLGIGNTFDLISSEDCHSHKATKRLAFFLAHFPYFEKNNCRSDFLATDPEIPGSIPGASRFSERQWVWNGVHSAS